MATSITNFQKWLDHMDAANHGKDKVSWVNTLKLTPHVEHDGERVLIPESQIYNVPEGFSLITVDADNTVPANFDTEGQMVQFTLDRSHVNYVKNVKAKWQLTAATADVIMAPPQFWVKRAEFWGNGPNGDKIQTLYSEQMFAHERMFYDDEQQVRRGRKQGFNGRNGLYQKPIVAATTEEFIVPLSGNWIEQTKGVYVPGLAEDSLVIKLYLATDPLVRNGVSDNGTLVITKLQLELEVAELPETDLTAIKNLYDGNSLEKDYLDTVLQNFATWTLTKGTDNRKTLTSFSGWCSYILMLIRPTGTLAYQTTTGFNGWGHFGNMFRTSHLGNAYGGAKVSIENAANNIISANSAIPPDHFQNTWSEQMLHGRFTEHFRTWYIIPFGDVSAAEEEVVRKGLGLFTTKEQLNLWPVSSNTVEVAEIDTLKGVVGTTLATADLTGGTYQLCYQGDTTSPISFSASLATIQGEIDLLFDKTIGFDGFPIICKVGGTLLNDDTPSGAITFTYTNLPGPRAPHKQGTILSVGAWACHNATVICTPVMTNNGAGVIQNGLATGDFQVDLYGRFPRHMHISNKKIQIKGFAI